MAGTIALIGGDEFRAGCEEADMAILKATEGERPRVLIVPTAAAGQNPAKAASNGVAYFTGLGARASTLMVLGRAEAANEDLLSPVDASDIIYFTGGDPVHLLHTLAGSPLLERVLSARRRGVVLAGSSAGAMVMGSWMRFRTWTAALGLVDGLAVLPHHERSEPSSVARELEETAPSGLFAVGIDGMTCCLGDDEGWRVVGEGTVTTYFEGRWHRYGSGETVPMPSSVRRT